MAHTILGGAIAAATGNDALSGALAAGGAEALAPTLTHFLYGKNTPDELSADEKQTISSIISLGGAGVGALVGGSGSDAVSGGQLAGNAVENNYLTQKNWNDYKKRVDECDDFRCVTKAQKDLYEISRLKNDELTSACGVNLDIAKCNRLIIEADAAKKITQKELDAFGDQNPKKPLPTFVQYYDVPWASNPNVHYWAASVDLPAFLGLGSGGSIVVNNVTNEVFIGYSVSKGTDNKAGFNAIAGIINNLSSFEKARLGITINDTLNGKSTGGQGCYWACAGVNKTVGADGPNRVSFEFGVGTPGASIGDTVLYPIGNILNFNRGNNVK